MNKALGYILLITALMVWLGGCSSDKKDEKTTNLEVNNDPLAMIIKQRSDSSSIDVAGHLSKIFDYTKIPFQTLDTDLLGKDLTIPPAVQLLCLTSLEAELFSDKQVEEMLSFVSRGNTLFITGPVFEDRFNFLTGVKKNASFKIAPHAEGFRFNKLVFPNFTDAGFKLPNPFYHDGLAREVFKDDVEIIATSYDSSKTPVITKNSVGAGQVIMFNSGIAYDKEYRGLLFSLMLSSLEDVPYPVANASTIFLDDFPAPLYDEKSPPIDKEYGMTEANFIAKVWWPAMQALADSFNINYTAMQAFNYNANVVPPFDFKEWEASEIMVDDEKVKGSIWLANQVKNSRHELAFHGYNHFSLWLYDWPNEEFMISSLRAAAKEWRIDDLGPLPVTYVPPSNNIDSVGIEALAAGMPQIRIMSSLYLGIKSDGGDREFAADPYNSNVFDYPRITSGYITDRENTFNQNSLYLLTGIWTHFIHPDDVFQVKQRDEDIYSSRNELGLGWHKGPNHDYGLYEVFKKRLKSTVETYPLIRFLTAQEAVPKVKAWNKLKVKRGHNNHLFYTSKVNQKGEPGYWFMYTKKAHADSVRSYLKKQADEYHFTPYWDGYLVQFRSQKDSLSFPDFNHEKNIKETPEQVKKSYLAFLSEEEEEQSGSGSGNWQDTRLQDARVALRKNPNSRQLQERTIELAIEFDRVPIAIDILEKRLLTNEAWNTHDIERLLTYYGWESESERGFEFLEQLWNHYHDHSIITFKDMLVEQYGLPDENFQTTWLKRELALNPNDESTLRKLIVQEQSEESWPQTKEYLHQLIKQNPHSDSLYVYTLQRSFYYDEPSQTLNLLKSFPNEAEPQLKPLAAEIANAYAYNAENYTKALSWAERADNYAEQTKLEWLLQQKRYKAFIERGDEALLHSPQNDSLRTFIGQQLIYEGFYEEGYARLYPLFKNDTAPPATQKLVHTEIGYQPYEQKKKFYQRYPAFFSDSLEQAVQHQYRKQEGTKIGLTANYASDNFNNTIGKIGAFTEWGNRQKFTHHITAEETFVGSNVELSNPASHLYNLGYRYQRIWPEKGFQLTSGAGFYLEKGDVRPDAEAGISYANDSTFTSLQLSIKPTLTTTALQRNINEFELSLYREDFWHKGLFQTTGSLVGKGYSNDVYSYEALGRLYGQLPFSTDLHRARGIAELSYSDATTSYSSGIPYYTPDKLFVQGIGADYRYLDILQNPNLSIEFELMGKHGNRDGFFLTSSARFNAVLKKYWEVSLQADISSSSVYRYNAVGFTVSYLFPKYLRPDR